MKAELFSEMSEKELEGCPLNPCVIAGGIDPPPSWEEYLAQFDMDVQEKILAIRECLREHDRVGTCAYQMANKTIFVFREDHTAISFTWRAWGDLMQAIVNQREGYMQYY